MIAVALVVACGMATYVAMLSVYESLNATRNAYYDRYRFADVFATVKRAPLSVVDRIREIPGVASVRDRVVTEVTLDVPGLEEPAVGRIVSVPDHRRPMINDLFIRTGRYIEPKRSDEVMVSEAFATANHLQTGDSIGAVINGRWQRLRIVATALSPEYIYEISGGAALFPDNRRFGILWMGRDALASAFDMKGAFNDVSLSVARGADVRTVIDHLDKILDRYGGIGAYDRDEQLSNVFIRDELKQLRNQAINIPLIFLGVAAFLLHITLSRLIKTQRDQVAVLKAFGYSNGAIALHYMGFAAVAVLIGALAATGLGIWAGSGLTTMYKDFFRFPILEYHAGGSVIIAALLISAVAAAVGALGAVRQVLKLPPAEAMRPEAPARFKPGPLERLGLGRLFSTSVRMIIRSLERNPVKASLSSLGIALSVAILIVGNFSYDSFEYLIDVEFRIAQRQDLTVVFSSPRPADTRYDLTSLPGVTRVEAFRAVPVNLVRGHRRRRLAIQGVVPESDLHRIVDSHLNLVHVPPNGVVLSSLLGSLLDVHIGDTLRVDVLEGRREHRQVRVAGFVDDLLGTSAYMDLHALNGMMQEGGTISGAYLMVDDSLRAQLYGQLKRTPAVAGVEYRSAAIKGLNDTIAESQGIARLGLIIFASVIAVGIVYNSARIALSERGRELASLRVLGFTRREITMMLLGEQAILTAAAIPVGFVLGNLIAGALLAAISSELYRMPLVISSATYASSALTVVGAFLFSALLVRRRLYTLDLIEVLKTRE